MKLTSHDGEQTLTLEWGGLSGRGIILTVEEKEDGHTIESAYSLAEDECYALATVLTKMAQQREKNE